MYNEYTKPRPKDWPPLVENTDDFLKNLLGSSLEEVVPLKEVRTREAISQNEIRVVVETGDEDPGFEEPRGEAVNVENGEREEIYEEVSEHRIKIINNTSTSSPTEVKTSDKN